MRSAGSELTDVDSERLRPAGFAAALTCLRFSFGLMVDVVLWSLPMFQVEVWIHVSAAGEVGWLPLLRRVERPRRLQSHQSVAYLAVVRVVGPAPGVGVVASVVAPPVWHNRRLGTGDLEDHE